MILDKIRNRGRDDAGEDAAYFAALRGNPAAAADVHVSDTPVFAGLLYERYGMTGDAPELFADVDRGLRVETRAWIRRNARPTPHPQAPDSANVDPHGDQDGSLSPATATESGQPTDTPAHAADQTVRRGAVQ